MIRFLPFLLTAALARASEQAEFYQREEIPLPPGEVMEIGSIALMPGREIAVTTRRGDLWICSGAYGDLANVRWRKFAEGLHEPFGMFWKDGGFYLTQRPEVSRVRDTDDDGLADRYEAVCAGWGINGGFHEYAFGSTPDRNGAIWVALCLSGSSTADSEWRGWCVRVTPEGKMIPTCSGIRSPGGIGFNHLGDAFLTDNQGQWNGSSSLKWLKPGSFQGNPTANKFHKLAKLPAPPEVSNKSRILIERTKFPDFVPPAVIFPHGKVGQSPTGIVCDMSGGKFGPWPNQLYVGEHTHSQVQRVCLEQVNGIYQGAVFHFLDGFESGLVPLCLDQDAGILFAGGSNRGWASRGGKSFSLDRVKWTSVAPFEIQTMTANSDGFTLHFTAPVDPTSAGNPGSYAMDAFTYILQADYGSPEVDHKKPEIIAARVSADLKSVRLAVRGLVRGHVHHLETKGVKSAIGKSLWHNDVYYTLNEIPSPP